VTQNEHEQRTGELGMKEARKDGRKEKEGSGAGDVRDRRRAVKMLYKQLRKRQYKSY
jgi:hypothetical protein